MTRIQWAPNSRNVRGKMDVIIDEWMGMKDSARGGGKSRQLEREVCKFFHATGRLKVNALTD